jgi:hypothetical protein
MSGETKTSRKRARTSSSNDSHEDPKLVFARAINAIAKQEEGFRKAVDQLADLKESTFKELQLRIEEGQRKLLELEEALMTQSKRRKQDIEFEIKQHGAAAVEQILKDRNEVAVAIDVYTKLQTQLKMLQDDFKKNLDASIKTERDRMDYETKIFKTNMDLEQKALLAKKDGKFFAIRFFFCFICMPPSF